MATPCKVTKWDNVVMGPVISERTGEADSDSADSGNPVVFGGLVIEVAEILSNSLLPIFRFHFLRSIP